ncbi:MAG: hypothetical protein AAGK04_06200 [Planctomycetota bacterium]
MQVPLRIAHFVGEDDVIPFDRRHDPRRRLEGEAVAVYCLPDGSRRISAVELRDIGGNGLGVVAESGAPIGSTCSVFESPPEHAAQRLRRLSEPVFHGRVVRAESKDNGVDIGLSLSRAAAA